MAECFKVEKPFIRRSLIDVGYEVPAAIVDITSDYVDLLVGRSQYRWDRKTGNLIQRDDGVKGQ